MAEGQWRQTVQAENFVVAPTEREAYAVYDEDNAYFPPGTRAGGTDCLKTENDAAAASGHAKTDVEPFDLTLIPYEALRRLGAVFAEGVGKYGRHNWRYGVGDKTYQLERANHAIKHLLLYVRWLQFGERLGDPDEDDLAKVMWFCATQAELERLEGVR